MLPLKLLNIGGYQISMINKKNQNIFSNQLNIIIKNSFIFSNHLEDDVVLTIFFLVSEMLSSFEDWVLFSSKFSCIILSFNRLICLLELALTESLPPPPIE